MRTYFLITLLLFSLLGCSSKKIKNQVNQEVAREEAEQENELYQKEQAILKDTPNLSIEQKNQLSRLLQRSRKEAQQVDREINRTKSVLFKSLVSEDGQIAKINVLENQLIKLNRKKTRQTLSSYREAKIIVGKSDIALDRTLNLLDNKDIHEF